MTAVLLLLLLAATTPVEEPVATLDRASVPATGSQSALLKVSRFGRYSIAASSKQGVSLQLVDRMTGPGPVAGAAGERDGRIDTFLERGEYRVLVEGAERSSGEAKLAVAGSAERNGPNPPLLVELKPVAGELKDHEQLSWWIQVERRRTVILEAAGRSLRDLRLWRDGNWLVDAEPGVEVVQPKLGQPLLVCRLAADLEPGVYLLTAYGGLPQPWAEESPSYPFHLRSGIPRLGEAGRLRHTVSPFGVDRYRVPGAVTYLRAELPEAAAASLGAGAFEEGAPFGAGNAQAEVTKKSLPPVAELYLGSSQTDHVVTVSGAEGQPYVLQHFIARESYEFRSPGPHWIATIHSGSPADTLDATAVVIRSRQREVVQAAVVELGSGLSYRRRSNLLGPLTLFLHAKEAWPYEVVVEGVEARVRVEPFLISRPANYKTPDWRGASSVWPLDAGYHVLSIEPVKLGIVTVSLRPKGAAADSTAPLPELRAAAQFSSVALVDDVYTVYSNVRPEVRTGLVVRSLPLDPADPLALTLSPGETVSVPVRIAEPGRLTAAAEDGTLVDVGLDEGELAKGVAAQPGDHTARLRNPGKSTVWLSLGFEPTRLAAGTPLPSLPEAAAPVDFPVLDGSRALDLDRDQSATFVVRADQDGLYQVESTGLLATEGHLRSRTVTSLFSEQENGVGRNFQVRSYLRQGDYQVTVKARGRTQGHLGLAVARSAPKEGGYLTNRLPARITLEAGEAVAYRFAITTPGTFRIRSIGQGRSFRCRLETEDGWPLLPPGGDADVTRDYPPGRYRFVVLPEGTQARVLTLIEPVVTPEMQEGHGPRPLPLAQTLTHLWTEPEGDAPRLPDVWEATLPAAVDATLMLDAGMQASVISLAADGSSKPLERPASGRIALPAGRLRIEVVAVRRNNRASYRIGLWPDQLVPGMQRDVKAPLELSVAVGETGLVEAGSFGSDDVRARLFDAEGRLVAASDDRPDDWNFLVSASLDAGRYRLLVDPVGSTSASTTVMVRTRPDEAKPALAVPATGRASGVDTNLGRTAQLFPLTLPARGDLLLVLASSGESLGIALEAQAASGWRSVATATGRSARLEVPLRERAAAYRLRLWSLDRRDSPARLSAALLAPSAQSEKELARGLTLAPVADLGIGVARIDLAAPGLLKAEGEGLRFCVRPGLACAASLSGMVPAADRALFVIGEGAGTVKASRVVLGSGGRADLALPGEGRLPFDLMPGTGPVVVRASSRVVQPGVSVDASPMAVAEGVAISVGLKGKAPAAVWAANGLAHGADVRLEAIACSPAERVKAGLGAHDGGLARGQARALDLPAGPKRIHLALSPGVVAALSTGDVVESVVAGDAESHAETLETAAQTLTLLGLREGRYAIEALPATAVATLAAQPFEARPVQAGTLRLPVSPAAGATLHVRGALATYVSADGRVLRGRDLGVPGPGHLLVQHEAAPLLAWLDAEHEGERGLAVGLNAVPTPVTLPASVPLDGAQRAFRISAGEPALLHLRTAAPLVSVMRRPGEKPDVDVHPGGTLLDVYLPAGDTEVALRGLAGAPLSGLLELFATPVTALGEGLGPAALLPPGGSRLYTFEVKSERAVGIGVKASADVVEATLLDARGQLVARGASQFWKLDPGHYLLALSVPAGSAPVEAQPALRGLELPGDGPPPDVIQGYLQPEEVPLTFSARRVAPGASAEDEQVEPGDEGQATTDEEETTPDEETQPDETQDEAPGGAL